MAIPIAALLAAGSNLVGQGVNWAATGSMNRKTRKFTRQMYDLQRQHSLSDWNMVNEYNSPAAQMRRFTEAGLNPNLIYGQMHEAGPIRGSNPDAWNPQAPQVDFGAAAMDGINAYYDSRLKDAQTDLALEYVRTQEEQQQLLRVQQLGTIAATAKTWADTGSSEFKLEMDKALSKYTMEAARLANEKQQRDISKVDADIGKVLADTVFTNDQNKRAAAQELRNVAMHSPNLKSAVQEWLNKESQGRLTEKQIAEVARRLDLLDYDYEFKALEAEFRRRGINLTDPWWLRVANKVQRILLR